MLAQGEQNGLAPLAQLIDPDSWLIDVKDVCRVCALSRTTVWRKVKAGEFPKPIELGPTRRAWRVGAVKAWLAEQV